MKSSSVSTTARVPSRYGLRNAYSTQPESPVEARASPRGLFAAEVLVCVHCAGRLRLVEIATEPEATRRIAREERRRRGEAESPVEARASPRGPPGQLSFTFR